MSRPCRCILSIILSSRTPPSVLRDVRTGPEPFGAPRSGSACCWPRRRCGISPPSYVVDTPLGPAEGRRQWRCRGGPGAPRGPRHARCGPRAASLGARRTHRAPARRADGSRLAAPTRSYRQSSQKSFLLMIDPMLATGGSAVAAIDLLRLAGAARRCGSFASWPRRRVSRLVEERSIPTSSLYAGRRSIPQRSEVHRPWARRFRRQAVWDARILGTAAAC